MIIIFLNTNSFKLPLFFPIVHDRFLDDFLEEEAMKIEFPISTLAKGIYDCDLECYVDAEGTPLTGKYGQPFPG